jgi:phospholipid/cholesterol/gamma-HCH transport system substrate-binding protein
MKRQFRITAVLALAALMISGCDFRGLNGLELPGSAGLGDDPFTVTVQVPDAGSLVNNSEVKVGDATVGAVVDERPVNYSAELTVRLNRATVLPENAVARVGLKSVLGASYLEIAPSTLVPPVGRLRDGDRIAINPIGNYPETEQVLAAASLLLNGGGLGQLNTITTELNNALDGRQRTARDLLVHLNQFTGGLNDQRGDIVRALDGLDRLAAGLNKHGPEIGQAIDSLPPALSVLNQQENSLVESLVSVNNLGGVAARTINGTRSDLLANLRDLQPTLQKLADSGDALPNSLISGLTGIFPVTTADKVVRGDYLNVSGTIDLTLPALDRAFLTGTPLAGVLTGGRAAGQAVNPLLAPLAPALPNTSARPQSGPNPVPAPRPAAPAARANPGAANNGGLGGLLGGGN